ncbi:ParA family protein [Xenorhabdus bovienii]|uniref:ParA family protein n=1 Tax=Xenorhabdus bovienii TaxID=40576 RepID=A0AAJ1J5N2_XENBV|nr:ParA family protein [Xenorhabdus bovienii]MDE1477600.1 ParA family protein [Xenorhabdus bovienii]MDE9509341.1 ParA family protein [Xenorhabdus bovienii]MDE9520986.1 ParA family protein [Xenorhabdus bovienii]
MSVTIYSMYNNKGGVGKTTLGFNIATKYAREHPSTQVLVIDMCPQANISQYLLGGGSEGYKQNQSLQSQKTRRNVVGFLDWILAGNSNFTSIKQSFKVQVNKSNKKINKNLFIIAGDSFLESLTLALNYAVINPANRNAWKEYMTAIRRLCELEYNKDDYDELVVFIDCNPSFSIYTQMALVSSDKLIVPIMADYSSLEGLKGIMTLLYGNYSSAASRTYAEKFVTFHSQIKDFKLPLPKLHRFIFNNFTTNSGVAKAYDAMKSELANFAYEQYKSMQDIFTETEYQVNDLDDWKDEFLSEVKDFHSSGKVSASLGIPLYLLPERTKYTMPNGDEVILAKNAYQEALDNISDLVDKF